MRDKTGRFVKGHKMPKEWCVKISKALKNNNEVDIPKEDLIKLYFEKQLSSTNVADIYGVSSSTIYRRMDGYGLKRRSFSQAHKGRIPWNRGKPWSEETKKKISDGLKGKFEGENNPMYGRQHSKETKRLIGNKASERFKDPTNTPRFGKTHSEETKQKISEKTSVILKERWADEEYKKKTLKNIFKGIARKPTRPEQIIMRLIDHHHLPFKYVGNGETIIAGLNPDFISLDGQKIIEVFGRAFHDPERTFLKNIPLKGQEAGRKAAFSEVGYDCLILWDDELENELEVVERIRRFH